MQSFVYLSFRLSYAHLTMAKLKGLCVSGRIGSWVCVEQQRREPNPKGSEAARCSEAAVSTHGTGHFYPSSILSSLQGRQPHADHQQDIP